MIFDPNALVNLKYCLKIQNLKCYMGSSLSTWKNRLNATKNLLLTRNAGKTLKFHHGRYTKYHNEVDFRRLSEKQSVVVCQIIRVLFLMNVPQFIICLAIYYNELALFEILL